jgi:hypothetical protein
LCSAFAIAVVLLFPFFGWWLAARTFLLRFAFGWQLAAQQLLSSQCRMPLFRFCCCFWPVVAGRFLAGRQWPLSGF